MLRLAVLLLLIICFSFPAYSFEFDVRRDMGECAAPPYLGKNCVTISYKHNLTNFSEAKNFVAQQKADFVDISKEAGLEIKLQYASEQIDPYDVLNNREVYKIDGKVTYILNAPEKAQKFIVSLKKYNYDADTLSALMAGSQCGWNYKGQKQ